MLIFGRFGGSVLKLDTEEDCIFLFNLVFIRFYFEVGVISYKVVLSFASR